MSDSERQKLEQAIISRHAAGLRAKVPHEIYDAAFGRGKASNIQTETAELLGQ